MLLLHISPWKRLGDRGGGKGRAGEVSWGRGSSVKPTLDGVWLWFSLEAMEGVGAVGAGCRHSTVSFWGRAPVGESESLAGELL